MNTCARLVADAERVIARGSGSFAAAAKLFDAPTRESVVLLYCWCRHCDDVIDGQDCGFGQTAQDGPAALARVDALVEATAAALRGGAVAGAPFAALAEVARRHRIPARFPLEHLSGFRMDAQARRYRSLADTLDYCYRVAGVVGVMMAIVMGRRDEATLDRAADLGLAFQLTNIARDVIDDHGAGRVYLPAEWLDEAGIPCDALDAACHRAALARVAARLVDAAEPYYASARVGLAALPPRSAWAVATAHGVYREIGVQVKARGAAAWDARVATSRRRKLAHMLGSVARVLTSRSAGDAATARRDGLYLRPGRGAAF